MIRRYLKEIKLSIYSVSKHGLSPLKGDIKLQISNVCANSNLCLFITVVVPKCFIKHMCFIVLYFHGHAFFSLEIAKKCFFVLYFLKNVLYFCKLFKWVNIYFKVLL